MLTASVGLSQSNKDSVTLYIPDALRHLEKSKKFDIAEKRIDNLQEAIIVLQEKIRVKDSMILVYTQKDAINELIKETHASDVKLLMEEKKIFQDQLDNYEKLLRKQRRKTRLVAAAGIITTGAAIALPLLIK